MKVFLDCIPCFVRQALHSARQATNNKRIHEEVLRRILRLSAELDMSQSPPAIGRQIHRLTKELTGSDDPYREIKSRFNNLALRLYPELRKRVINSGNPLDTAIRLAIAGNIIDLGVKTSIEESEIEGVIRDCLTADFDSRAVEAFANAVNQAERILYLADNAGEIVLDRLLIERLPIEKVAIAVKGSPVINDATMEDALIAGLPRIVEVIDNGSDAPGTILETCSEPFRGRFQDVDLIIAKGQGNYETLSDSDKNIFFILKAKCPVIARDLGCEVGEMILRKSRAFSDIGDLVKEAE
ncbi:MAG: DUF89 family protein [Sedimentisphaerales bacterium]|nr:DUF89 family protein [Sedimentisphaerales bacterium]